ncbi:hypothetical protein [Methanobrevibacter sp.]|uniref:hypothetical protein n=1 Tax=Methanobrevibacter sp. TaxID=66852 RepID=UPI00386C757B
MRHEEEIFGNLKEYKVWSDESDLKENDTVMLVNSNCEFQYDNIKGCFEKHSKDLMYCYVCELELIETDLSDYVPERSTNGGAYAFAECKVVKIIEKSY